MGTTFSISDRQAQGLRRVVVPLLVALALMASQLPIVGALSADAAIGPWNIDGVVPDSTATMQTFADPCDSATDDKPINGNAYKLNAIHNAGTPVFDRGNVTGKSDLCNVWLDLATDGDDVLLYFAWQRFSAQGAVNVSLELQQGSLAPSCQGSPDFFTAGGCNPFANRQAGDLLVTFDFDPVPQIYIRTWTGSDWGPEVALSSTQAEAAIDGDKNSTLRGESAINLTDAGILPAAGVDCVTFATVLPFSQTGNSTTAELQDIVLNGFPGPNITNCGQLVVEKVTSPAGLEGPFPVVLSKGATTLSSFDLDEHGSTYTYGDSGDEDLFAGGDYTLTETVPSGWDPDYTVACTIDGDNAIDGDGNITVEATETTSCVITNTAIAPTLTLIKTVDAQYGGTATAADFQARLDGSDVDWDTAIATTVGSHTASEVMNVPGYEAGDWGGDCAADGSITLGPGDEATCTITNSDIQPTLTLEKTVDNSAGGTATEDDFQASIDDAEVDWDAATGLDAGDYTASEATLPGYTASDWGGDCAADGSVSLLVGDEATCTITNTAIAPTLTVVKEVVNNAGGTAEPGDFPLFIGDTSVVSGASNDVVAGVEYTVSEEQQPGYAQTGLVCVDDDTGAEVAHPVTLALAQSVTCTITNDDVMPGLTVLKNVINDDGGALGPDDFQLRVNGGPIDHGVALANPQAGVAYEVTEDDPSGLGYEELGTVCVDAGTGEEVANPVTLALGQAVVCTITNDDIGSTVTVTKRVINDDGGTAEIGDFTLYLGEAEVTSGVSNEVTAGVEYTVSEDLVDGYEQVSLECSEGEAVLGSTFTPGLGQDVDCVIVNDDIAPTVTVTKEVINDDGGTAEAGDFTLLLGDDAVVSGASNEVTAGVEYTVSEDLVDGYEQVSLACTSGEAVLGSTFTPGLGQVIDCVIVNDDIAPTVTVTKEVINDDGGTAEVADFTLLLGDDAVVSGASNDVTAGVEYTVSEVLVDGYEQVSLECTSGEAVLGDTFTPDLAQVIDCLIVNDDIAPTVTVVKAVINDDGGTAEVADFALYLGETSVTSGASNDVVAGTEYTVSEDPQPGYAQTGLVCVDDTTELEVDHPVTLALAQSVTCTITNDDAAPGLTVVKNVINDDGGALGPDDFQLRVNGDAVEHGVALSDPQAGVAYEVTEDDPSGLGYEEVGTVCVDAETQETVANPVTLALGQAVVCTITNDDIAPTVTVTKEVINDDGGTAEIGDFTLYLGEVSVTSDASNEVTAGVEYTVSEDLVDGYEQVSLECSEGEAVLGSTFTPGLGQDIDCVIVNDDIAPTVTVSKIVVNDDGGTAEVGDFTLLLGDDEVVSGASNEVTAGVEYTVSEELVDGYEQVGFICTDGDQSDVGDTFTPELAENISCVIINDDIAPTVTVTKEVINDDGGTAEVADFTLLLGDDAVVSGASNDVTAGVEYTVSEVLVDGYEQVSLACSEGEAVLGSTFTPELGQDIDCVIVNDDIAPTVTVSKIVVNDDGGTAEVGDFTLLLGDDEVVSGASNEVTAGVEYTVSEELVDGYEQTSLACTDAGEADLGDTFTPALGQTITCLIVNDDLPSGISLVKEAVLDADDEGIKAIEVAEGETATVTYRFLVTNTGETTLTELTLVDDKIGAVTLDVDTLAPGETTEAFADYTLTEADIAAGRVDNIGTVTGTDVFGNDQDDSDDETVFVIEVLGQVSGIDLIKTALVETDGNGNKIVEVEQGETATVTYRYLITNTGNTTIADLSLVDDKIGAIALPATSLAAGASMTVDVDYTLTAADIAAGAVENVAVVTGTDETGTEVSDTDDEVVEILEVREVVVVVPTEVKPSVISRPPLPRTGTDGEQLFALAVLLAAVGAATLLFTPRRRRDS